MSRVLIIGAGLAGFTVARELLALRPDASVTLVTQDDGHQYPKPQLSASLRLGKQPDDLITQRAEALVKRGIQLIPRSRVSALHPDRQEVALEDGRVLPYDALVLALGASPFVPPMAGESRHVLTVNHLDDYRRFRERLVPGKPVLIVGAGLIGLEFTADLLSQGYRVAVVDPGQAALPRLLPRQAAGLVAGALEREGAVFHWQRTVAELHGEPGAFEAQLSDGSRVQAGTVLSAVGLRPHTELARSAGLPVGRGIQVDAHMRVAANIYAVGDCAELPGGLYLPFIRPIGETAKYVARAIAGEATSPVSLANYTITVKVPMWPITSSTPLPDEQGEWEEAVSERGSLSKLVAPDGRLMRVVATGDRTPELGSWLEQLPVPGSLSLV